MNTSNSIVYSQASLPTERKLKGRGDKIVVGAIVKSKIGELEGGGKGRKFKKDEEGVDWCGSKFLREEDVLGEV